MFEEYSPIDALRTAKEMRKLLDAQIAELEKKAAKEAIPSVPAGRLGDAFDIHVQFSPGGKQYRYLLLRNDGVWYTTGQTTNARFANWAELIRWLKGPDVHWHSTMRPLLINREVVGLRQSDDWENSK